MIDDDSQNKCDFLLNKQNSKNLLLLELKSQFKARLIFDQFQETKIFLSARMSSECRYKYILVYKDIDNTELQKLIKRLKNEKFTYKKSGLKDISITKLDTF